MIKLIEVTASEGNYLCVDSETRALSPYDRPLREDAPLEMIISFANASSAITADKLLSEAGIVAMVMPAPSAIQTGCGFCLRLSPKLLADAIKLIESNGVAYSGVFSRTEEQGVSAYRPLGQGTDAGGISVEK